MIMRVSLIFPPSKRSITMPQTDTGRSVAGTPRNNPRCVPFHSKRDSTLSPSTICSWTDQCISGNADLSPRSSSFNPSRPCPWPGRGTYSTMSSQKNCPAASTFPWFRTSSMNRRTTLLLLCIFFVSCCFVQWCVQSSKAIFLTAETHFGHQVVAILNDSLLVSCRHIQKYLKVT